jgi:hypothetical protein
MNWRFFETFATMQMQKETLEALRALRVGEQTG